MEKERVEKFRQKLEAEKNKIGTEIEELAGHLKEHETAVAEEEERALFDEEELESSSRRERRERQRQSIEHALTKIEKGVYGLCEKCGREIEPERLEMLPTACLCSTCKKVCDACGTEIHDARVLGRELPPRCQNCEEEFVPELTFTSFSIQPA